DQDVAGDATAGRAAGGEGRCTVTAPEHVFDELPGLLAGELDRSTTGRVAAHLRACDDCRQELVLVVSAGAALQSAIRFAPHAVPEPGAPLPAPGGLRPGRAPDRHPAGGQPGTPTQTGRGGSGPQSRPGPKSPPVPGAWPGPQARHEPETGRRGTAGPDTPG